MAVELRIVYTIIPPPQHLKSVGISKNLLMVLNRLLHGTLPLMLGKIASDGPSLKQHWFLIDRICSMLLNTIIINVYEYDCSLQLYV